MADGVVVQATLLILAVSEVCFNVWKKRPSEVQASCNQAIAAVIRIYLGHKITVMAWL